MSEAGAFPLSWPAGYPRTKTPRRARFRVPFTQARDGLFHELRLMYAMGVVLSTNIELNRNGVPYAGRTEPEDSGVAVYFLRNGKRLVLACDQWRSIADNLNAVRLSLQAMRGLDRWGCSDILERAFMGFAALPDYSQAKTEHWTKVLEIPASATVDSVEAAYRNAVKRFHPDLVQDESEKRDRGALLAKLNRAIAEARSELGGGLC